MAMLASDFQAPFSRMSVMWSRKVLNTGTTKNVRNNIIAQSSKANATSVPTSRIILGLAWVGSSQLWLLKLKLCGCLTPTARHRPCRASNSTFSIPKHICVLCLFSKSCSMKGNNNAVASKIWLPKSMQRTTERAVAI